MMSSVFKDLLDPALKHQRYERYDGINEVLIISNNNYELKITSVSMKLDSVVYAESTADKYHSIPVYRKNIALINHQVFVASGVDEINGVTDSDVKAALEHYRKFG